MKKYRNLLFYLAITLGFLMAMYFIVQNGRKLELTKTVRIPEVIINKALYTTVVDSLLININSPLSILLLQIIVILIA
ncbi:MAG: hypothetical protein WKF89_19510, partial [Chitinophagaceae bacterium]